MIKSVYYLEASTRVNNPAAPESFCCLGKKKDSNIWNISIESFVGTFCQSSFLFQSNLSFSPTYLTLRSFEYQKYLMFWNAPIKWKPNMFACFLSICPRSHSFALIHPFNGFAGFATFFLQKLSAFVWSHYFSSTWTFVFLFLPHKNSENRRCLFQLDNIFPKLIFLSIIKA